MVKITTNIDIVKFDSLVLKLDLYSGMRISNLILGWREFKEIISYVNQANKAYSFHLTIDGGNYNFLLCTCMLNFPLNMHIYIYIYVCMHFLNKNFICTQVLEMVLTDANYTIIFFLNRTEELQN